MDPALKGKAAVVTGAVKGIYSETKWTLNDIITAVPALRSGVNIELK